MLYYKLNPLVYATPVFSYVAQKARRQVPVPGLRRIKKPNGPARYLPPYLVRNEKNPFELYQDLKKVERYGCIVQKKGVFRNLSIRRQPRNGSSFS